MRRDTTAADTGWAADIPFDEAETFEQLLPVKGAFTAVITIGLRSFLARCEDDPMLQVRMHEAIAEHIYNEPKPAKQRALSVRIPTPLYERFNTVFPEWGATSWFIRRLMSQVVERLRDEALVSQVEDAVFRMVQPKEA